MTWDDIQRSQYGDKFITNEGDVLIRLTDGFSGFFIAKGNVKGFGIAWQGYYENRTFQPFTGTVDITVVITYPQGETKCQTF